MDSITRLSQKILAERARNGTQQQPTPSTAPPPYSESDMDSDSDDDSDDDESNPVKLMINAAHSIQGSNNLVPTSPTPLADATKFSTLLLHAVNQINAVAGNNSTPGQGRARRPLKVDLTINCGITVIGDRNVIGNIGLKPKPLNGVTGAPTMTGAAATASTPAVAGAKRKSEESDPMEEEAPAAKKVATGEAGDD